MLFQRKIPHGFSFHVLIALGVALLGLVALSVGVAAHAQYDHSLPAANARLPSGHPPPMVQVWFTEQIEPAFSSLTVYNQAKQRVDAHDSHVAPDNPSSMIVSLQPSLPDGAYTVVFQNVSLDDGHHVVGAFSFVVGGGPLPTNTDALLSNVQPSDENLNGWSIAIRWLNYLGMAALVGGLAFLLLVWRPTLVQLETSIGPELSDHGPRFTCRSQSRCLVPGSCGCLAPGEHRLLDRWTCSSKHSRQAHCSSAAKCVRLL
jgi:copper transport protein